MSWNTGVIAEFRKNHGKVGGNFEGAPLLLINHKGARTGNNMETSFTVTVQDNGEPGPGQDTFAIQLGTGYSKFGVLQGGDIQVH